MRVTKTVNGTKHTYLYVDGLLMYEKRGDKELYFWYDGNGHLAAIRYYYNTAGDYVNLYALTNSMGDVLALYGGSGALLVTYEYDAWGNLVYMNDTTALGSGTVNPIRYRGYYYDTDTGLYYCQSRYYDPQVGRWLNADEPAVLLSNYESVLQYNSFSYCFNNSINMQDESGLWPSWKKMAKVFLKGAVVATTVAVVAAIIVGTGGAGALALAAGGSAALASATSAALVSISTAASYIAAGALVGVGYCALGQGIQYMSQKNAQYNNSQKKGTPKSNTAQNKQVDSVVKKLKLNKKQRRLLHEEITGKNFSYQEILETARDMFGK